MAKVDFYVLKASGDQARQQFACRLAEKAYRLKNTVHIQAATSQVAGQLDELLWTFRDGSFVPHELTNGSSSQPDCPVTIGCEAEPPGDRDLLINLAESIPNGVASCSRVAEIVSADDDSLATSRKRFVAYRDDGHTLETHKL
ncbi:MAG: DNA polymerase-3 subunit chi [Woeseiaceae bacterium]|jgi:DNA polymerase-3 subunit chi